MSFIYNTKRRDDEDLIQTAWVKALEKTEERPPARTVEELQKNYQHIAGLVVYIYQKQKINKSQKLDSVSLTDNIPVEYTMISELDNCTPIQREAIEYYLELVQQKEPIRAGQRAKLKRYRKLSGLVLDLNY